jgi:protein transport protein SEC23
VDHISSGFDQEAAAVLVAKMAVHRAETGKGLGVIKMVDDTVVWLVSELLRKLDTV